MNNDAKVMLWGSLIGAVTWLEDREIGVFQYSPEFLESGIELSPFTMPPDEFPYEFPALARNTFKGLPGMLADCLPDKYGNAIIDAWLASQGRNTTSFHPVERLCYVGSRGMGALEFEPATLGPPKSKRTVEVASLVELANQILDERASLGGVLSGGDDREEINDILRVGTSAGGARAKAILAWNPATGEFRSGQVDAGAGFEYWLMKFDGISSITDTEIATPKGYGKIEYAYHLMAREAGIEMTACCLHHEGGRSHFMTKRFDRTKRGGKLHMQSLGALAHFDYKQPASYSYEQAIEIIQRLAIPRKDVDQQVLRAFFNVVGRNCDDHVKNISFLMNRRGEWSLSPAFDVLFAWNPTGPWTSRHQMSVNGKREGFMREDLLTLAGTAGIKKGRANQMLDRVIETVRRWSDFATEAGVSDKRISEIQRNQLTEL
ncbi:MAG: type II toxin-antitoxin system HipA family toxin [Candidatus Electryonea clarkiae]|nr:type II toxin-antitoxin system HipA family toxin [Candidatus Electryonea clarkiae]MDP8286955.1 type II toxin-antitoxin system HipA family toxin [Candidatus Electryonea clarkiae]